MSAQLWPSATDARYVGLVASLVFLVVTLRLKDPYYISHLMRFLYSIFVWTIGLMAIESCWVPSTVFMWLADEAYYRRYTQSRYDSIKISNRKRPEGHDMKNWHIDGVYDTSSRRYGPNLELPFGEKSGKVFPSQSSVIAWAISYDGKSWWRKQYHKPAAGKAWNSDKSSEIHIYMLYMGKKGKMNTVVGAWRRVYIDKVLCRLNAHSFCPSRS